MRNAWLVLLGAAFAAADVRAAEIPKLGGGVALGVPFGATAKYWFDSRRAVQSHLGVSDGDLTFDADVLRNFDQILPRKRPGTRMPLYAGLGVKFKAEAETFVGIRFVGGVSMFHSVKPIEFFAEVAPVLRLSPSEGGTFDGAVGVRRYF
ncbi:MAG: hypothetical protein HY403_01875 [Elusimicrobia bacterium]|nr:hypothetical protein [Elusimicrobiota bacterium]